MVVPKVEEDEDESLRIAIALSLKQEDSDSALPIKQESTPPQAPNSNFLSALNRKEMEQERLKRLSKRTRSISPPSFSPRKAAKIEETSVDLPSGARLNFLVRAPSSKSNSDATAAAQTTDTKVKLEETESLVKKDFGTVSTALGSTRIVPGNVTYPFGVVKKTWAFGHSRTADDIKLEEVLEASTLSVAVLSSFQWDMDWILSKLKIRPSGGSTKCVFVMQAKEEELRQQILRDTEDMRDFLRVCLPPMIGQTNCMHSKLMLLFHPKKLRVAIPTANLLSFDWGETGHMENSCFLIDLPRLPDGDRIEASSLTPFGAELLYFMKRQTMSQDIQDAILQFDFSATKDIAFIHSVGGVSFRKDAGRTGVVGLGRAIQTLGLSTRSLEIDFAASSIGSLNDNIFALLHSAARGEDLIPSSAKSTKGAAAKPAPDPTIREKIRIYFPTHETVRSSTAGAVGSVCISRKWWEAATFPKQSFRDYISTRSGLLSHNKIMYARGKRPRKSGAANKDVAWVYVGSANMSESAWGKPVQDRKTKEWRMNCRNWECGVLIPVSSQRLAEKRGRTLKEEPVKREDSETESENADSETESETAPENKQDVVDLTSDTPSRPALHAGDLVDMSVFDNIVKPPFLIPGPAYGNRHPWFFQEQ